MAVMEFSDVGIDLGTSSVLVYVKGKGIVLREPSILAVNRLTGELVAIGEEARVMLGRTPANIVAVRPLRDGVISNFHDTERMLRYFLRKTIGKKMFFKPRVVICVPSGVTEVEKRAVIDATEEAGGRHPCLVEEPVAAAIGAGLDIGSPTGTMVVDIGGGTTDIAVMSLGGVVTSTSVKMAGDKFDEAIVKFLKKKFNILVGDKTAEEIKMNIGSASPRKEDIYMEVTGRNLVNGLPKTILISANETVEGLQESLQVILDTIHEVIEKTPPELTADIYQNGLCLTGGGSLLYGLTDLITEKLNMHAFMADDPISAVALGAGICLDNIEQYQDIIYDYRRGDFYSY